MRHVTERVLVGLPTAQLARSVTSRQIWRSHGTREDGDRVSPETERIDPVMVGAWNPDLEFADFTTGSGGSLDRVF